MTSTLRVLRAQHRLSQADLAARVGVSRQSINAIEAGRYVPSTILALKLAHVFGVSVEHVFKLEPDELEGLAVIGSQEPS
ncbi:MAG: helix-turn-helix transcriptional regulator [Phycisphaerales bacterium]|jgi:putative transcriptional regulator